MHAHAARAHSPYSHELCADVRALKTKVLKSVERRMVFNSAATCATAVSAQGDVAGRMRCGRHQPALLYIPGT